jgi:hypothetical protein
MDPKATFLTLAGLITRGLLQALGGALISLGVADQQAVAGFTTAAAPILSGLVVMFLAWAWSLVQKRRSGVLTPQ